MKLVCIVRINRILRSSLGSYQFKVKEDAKPGSDIGVLGVEDRDEIQNKDPTFTLQQIYREVFDIKPNNEKDGILSLKVVHIERFTTVTLFLCYFCVVLSKANFPLKSITGSGLRNCEGVHLQCICGRAHSFKTPR